MLVRNTASVAESTVFWIAFLGFHTMAEIHRIIVLWALHEPRCSAILPNYATLILPKGLFFLPEELFKHGSTIKDLLET